MTGPLAELPEGLLHTLSAVIPDFTLVGSFARDYRVHTIAGLPRVAQTLDVDIAILVPSMTDYRTQMKPFNGPHGTGIAFLINGIQVDVIPYGPQIAPQGIVETLEGVTLDVTGMNEAAATAEQVPIGTATVKIPTLSSMIGLKLVAWAYRNHTTQKDARDLGPLITATYHGPSGEDLWTNHDAGMKWAYDDMLMGPYIAGRELASTWGQASLDRLNEILQPTGIAELSTQIARSPTTPSSVVAEQLKALRQGISQDA